MSLHLPFGGIVFEQNKNSAFSGASWMRFRITQWNWPTVKSAGTRYFFLSMSGMSDRSAFSQITGTRSGYLARIRSASDFLFSAEKQANVRKIMLKFLVHQVNRGSHVVSCQLIFSVVSPRMRQRLRLIKLEVGKRGQPTKANTAKATTDGCPRTLTAFNRGECDAICQNQTKTHRAGAPP